MRYALIIAGYALVLWGIYTIRRESGQGRTTSYREGQAEVEAVVEEFVAAAERVRSDLERKSAELQRLISLADDRLAKLIQAQTAAAAPAIVPAAPAAEPVAKTAAAGKTPATPAPSMATQGRAAAAASYRAQAGDNSGSAEASDRAHEAQSVRATLTGGGQGAKADPAPGRTEPGERKPRKDRSRHAEVYQLADDGQGVTEIARVTGLSKGEVQLILDLRKTR